MRYLKLSLFGLLFFPAGETTAGDDPNKATFAYKPFMQATYAVYHREEPPPYNERPYTLLKLFYEKQSLYQEKEESPSIRVLRYERRYLNMRAIEGPGTRIQIDFSLGGHIDLLPGGLLASLATAFRRPVPEEDYQRPLMSSDARLNEVGSMLSREAFRMQPLSFPILEAGGMTLQEGQRWQYSAPPFVLLKGTFELLRENKLRPKELPPTTIHSHWKDWKKVDGRRCAVIDFWFEAKADEKLKQGKEDGEVRYEGTSYFSPELGLPVVTVLRGDGFVVDKRGNKNTIFLRRKEVLVHFEPYSEEKARQKRALEAAQRKADETKSSGRITPRLTTQRKQHIRI